MKIPDPRWHQRISFTKSALRILAGVALINLYLVDAGLLLVVAEVLGIIEEVV